MILNSSSIPNSNFLQQKISRYQHATNTNNKLSILRSKNSLTLMKAWDAVKDGSSTALAYAVFGITQPNERINPSECKNLPEYIKQHFESKVRLKQIRCLTYTRRKGSVLNKFDDNNTLNADYGIADCGPNYSDPNSKTPLIKSTRDTVMRLLFSLGNFMDTGPSSKNKINLTCNKPYNIPQDVFNALGYNISNMTVTTDVFTISLLSSNNDPIVVTKDEFKQIATGNAQKKTQILGAVATNFDYKRQLLYFKSLGDTMIVYFWLWACRSLTEQSIEQSIALLTCDTVVALQADIFSQGVNNAYWVLNHNEKGEKHISRVYAKDAPTDYSKLFEKEKKEILKHYDTEIGHFRTINESQCEVNIGNRNLRPHIDALLRIIHERLTSIRDYINNLIYNSGSDDGFTSYKNLKQYGLLPLIRSGNIRDGYILIRTRFKFYVTDDEFLSTTRDKLNLEAIIKSYIPGGVTGGRNSFFEDLDNYNSIFLKDVYTTKNTDDLAIEQLQETIKNILNKLIKKLKRDIQTKIYSLFIKLLESHDNYGSVYDMLTYEFYNEPLYSTDHITSLCQEILLSVEQSIIEMDALYIEHNDRQFSTIQTNSHPDPLWVRLGGSSKNRKKYIKISNKSNKSKKQKTSSRRTRKRHHKIK